MASFTIKPDDIRSGQRAAKIRTLAKQGSTEGERTAAQSKTKGPSMPKVKAGDKNIRDIDIVKPLYLNYPIVKDHTNIV